MQMHIALEILSRPDSLDNNQNSNPSLNATSSLEVSCYKKLTFLVLTGPYNLSNSTNFYIFDYLKTLLSVYRPSAVLLLGPFVPAGSNLVKKDLIQTVNNNPKCLTYNELRMRNF
jgi:hypothetical protein